MSVGVVDLFCGIGGLTKGLELAGLHVVAGLDFDESCSYAYEFNNNSKFIHRDITEISGKEIEMLYQGDDIRVLVGCAPCQPFSKYTVRYRRAEWKRGREGDPWQIDKKWRLLSSFARLVKETNPHIVSMENVPELAREKIFFDFLNILEKTGYRVCYQIVFCPDYGVPQNRRRLVLFASRLGDIALVEPSHKPGDYRTVRDSIGDLPPINDGEADENDLLHSSSRLSDLNRRRIKNTIEGGSWRDWEKELIVPCHRKASGRSYGSVYGRMLWNQPSPTITTQFYGYGNGRFGHPQQHRALSLREGALLQSFPSDYVFFNAQKGFNRRKIGAHIGNAVPVELGKAIGISILNHIKEKQGNAENG
jgi:DNA (cytosine-5)-methyltransferase 1